MTYRLRSGTFVTLVSAILVALLLLPIGGCRKKRTPQEQLTVERIGPCCRWLEDYKRDYMCYPESWDVLLRWKQAEMPINPFTNQPMVSLDSADFDRELSPGNFYYAKVVQEDCVINCQVIIFGEKGEIARYTHAGPLSAK
jgi:hypothetical protein